MAAQGSEFHPQVEQWVKENPELVNRWMADPSFRERLLDNLDEYFAGYPEAARWVKERVRAVGYDRLTGKEAGSRVAF